MLVSNMLGPRITLPVMPVSTSTGGNTPGSGSATPHGGTSQAAAPAPTAVTPPSAPPQRSEPVQPTTAAPTAGTATSHLPRARADASLLSTRPRAGGGSRPAPAAGTIEAEVRRLETVEAAEITKSELIKQPSVALLAQANLRQQDVLDILNG